MHKFLCDVNIPFRLSNWLNENGYVSVHVNNILNGDTTTDSDIISFVETNDYVMITKDDDFRRNRAITNRPKKLIMINTGNLLSRELVSRWEKHFSEIKAFLDEPKFKIEFHG